MVSMSPNDVRAPMVTESVVIGSVNVTIEGYGIAAADVADGDTVLDVLHTIDARDEKLALITKEYAGLGVLVESMGGQVNGTNNEYWQYTVNGIMPQVGADAMHVQNGDTIEWYFGSSESGI